MKYQLIARNSKHVDAIVKAVGDAEHIYLATDRTAKAKPFPGIWCRS